MKIKLKYHFFKFKVDVKELDSSYVELSFLYQNAKIHLKKLKSEYNNENYVFILTEPTFFRKKPEIFVWDLNEEKVRQIYSNYILKEIKAKELRKWKQSWI